MGIEDGKIISSHAEKQETVKELLKQMITEDDEILTILYGKDVTEAEVQEIESYVEEHYEDVEIETHNGKQPIYSYIFAVE